MNRWFSKKHPRNEPPVKIPPLRGDENRDMTVIQSLECRHNYNTDDDNCSDSHYFTEHDVHGNFFQSYIPDQLLQSLKTKFFSSKASVGIATAYAAAKQSQCSSQSWKHISRMWTYNTI